jgi:hypothetical protein
MTFRAAALAVIALLAAASCAPYVCSNQPGGEVCRCRDDRVLCDRDGFRDCVTCPACLVDP